MLSTASHDRPVPGDPSRTSRQPCRGQGLCPSADGGSDQGSRCGPARSVQFSAVVTRLDGSTSADAGAAASCPPLATVRGTAGWKDCSKGPGSRRLPIRCLTRRKRARHRTPSPAWQASGDLDRGTPGRDPGFRNEWRLPAAGREPDWHVRHRRVGPDLGARSSSSRAGPLSVPRAEGRVTAWDCFGSPISRVHYRPE